MGRQRRPRTGALALACVGVLAFATACSPGTPQQSGQAGNASDTAQLSSEVTTLLPPSDTPGFAPKYAEAVKGPVTGAQIALPYTNVLPLPDGPIGDPNKTYTFCFSQALTGSTWAVGQQESVMIEAARHPNVKLLTYNTNNDPL